MYNNFSFRPQSQRILGRNEGKIKSYESCSDLRAWCHDPGVRDRYLREWMRSNMPICVIPVTTWASLLRIISCRRRGQATPRCHSDCKSKVVLDSICDTCEAVRETLKNDSHFDKYFVEEELETSHWPMEKCLEALKSVKIFWKIIFEKIFRMNHSKSFRIEEYDCTECNTVKEIAKMWARGVIEETSMVKDALNRNKLNNCTVLVREIEDVCDNETKPLSYYDIKSTRHAKSKLPRKKISRCISVRTKMTDDACQASDIELAAELKAYKRNLYRLQQQFRSQYEEIKKLKTENISLKLELQNVYQAFPWKSPFHSHTDSGQHLDKLPKPFETPDELPVNVNKTENVDSELVITLKNGQNESLKNIEILQVLHKTHMKTIHQKVDSKISFKNEDPVLLLKRVHDTFGAIFEREICIASERRHNVKAMNINATFQRVHPCQSEPSCGTVSAYSSCSP